MNRPAVFALLWCFPSFGAAWILAMDAPRWAWGRGAMELLGSVRLEDWVALGLLAVHGAWVRAWLRTRRPGGHGRDGMPT